MSLEGLIPNLMVEDVAATLAFYETRLGFMRLATMPTEDAPFDWAMVGRDSVHLMFQSRASLSGEQTRLVGVSIGASQTLYITVSKITDFYHEIKDKVEVIKPLQMATYNRWEFYIVDCNGYILGFSESAQVP